MRNMITDNRLPEFSAEESQIVKGAYDFLGLNHYTSKFVHHSGDIGRDYGDDGRFWTSSTDKNGNLIGPYAECTWLNVYPLGMRKLLNWIDKRYNHPPIYVFENGVSVPGETKLPLADALHDSFRLNYYKDYIQNMEDAIQYDGVDVRGYFAWSLIDNFEWANGYNVRFGMVFIDFENNQERHIKDSAYWYSDWIKSKRE